MKITGAAMALIAVALVGAPIVRHRIGSAGAQPQPAHGIDPNLVAPTIIGMNAGGISYYGSEQPFADEILNNGQPSFMDGNSIKEDQVQRDDDGNITNAPIGLRYATRLHGGKSAVVPGTYHCQISPGWRVEQWINLQQVSQSGTKFTAEVPKGAPNVDIGLQMTATKNGAALTTLSCRYPGEAADALFRKDYLEDMRPFRIIRFMDWMGTNNAPERTWAKRPTAKSVDQSINGVAVEYMVALANELHSDPWFTLPLDADDDYYRNFAIYVRDHLSPGQKAYVELSNEVWNDGFKQSKDATARGQKAYPGVSADKANDYYYADRVRGMMAVWSDVFKGQEKRIVRVLASQVWAQRGDQRLGHKETWKYVDALAIAPYWGDAPFDVPGTGQARIDGMFAKAPALIDATMKLAHDNKAIAAKYGLPLITYEGGPGYQAFEPGMVKDVDAMEADPRFYALYQGFLRRWQKEIGGPLVLYQATADSSFGHLRYTGQPLADSPKMRAVVDFIRQQGH